MALITPAQVVKLGDKATAIYSALLSGLATPDTLAEGIADLIEGSADSSFANRDLQIPLNNGAAALASRGFKVATLYASAMQSFLGSLSNVAAKARDVNNAIGDLDSFAYYYNVTHATKWQCMFPPQWRFAFAAVGMRGYTTGLATPNKKNLYYPVIQGDVLADGGTATNGLAKLNVATEIASPGTGFTDGIAIDHTLYAGGFPYIKWTGGAGSGACSIVVTGSDEDNATRTYSLTGSWGVGAFVATQAGVALTPAVADKLITNVTSIVVTGMTTGVMYVESHPPTGRTYPAA